MWRHIWEGTSNKVITYFLFEISLTLIICLEKYDTSILRKLEKNWLMLKIQRKPETLLSWTGSFVSGNRTEELWDRKNEVFILTTSLRATVFAAFLLSHSHFCVALYLLMTLTKASWGEWGWQRWRDGVKRERRDGIFSPLCFSFLFYL